MTQETSHTRKGKTAVIKELLAASRAGFAIVVKSGKDDLAKHTRDHHIDTSHEDREV